ncbi:hypothetical protein AB0N06_19235 [Streptomyces sp. NPDC051020]|uniref:hypothetical protein n=1 Tax=Streptomyces sp. NPDC051020 TaxID=3155409 RepID=UPI0034229010
MRWPTATVPEGEARWRRGSGRGGADHHLCFKAATGQRHVALRGNSGGQSGRSRSARVGPWAGGTARPAAEALTGGYDLAFAVGTGLLLVVLAAATVLRPARTGQVAEDPKTEDPKTEGPKMTMAP